MKKTSYEISYDVITSIGERKTNEDAYGILELPDKKYFLVCDGLGGHGDGEVASSFVVETMKQCLAEGLSVEDSIMKSQNQLLEKQRQEHKESGMKTTLTCLEIKDEKASFLMWEIPESTGLKKINISCVQKTTAFHKC